MAARNAEAGNREMVPICEIEQRIFLIRGQKVMIAWDLAALYRVPTKVLNQAVKRNQNRFPDGFMFRLSREEARELVKNNPRIEIIKHAAATPFVFTEYGVAMLSSILRSRRAVQINVQIIQTFIRLRQWALTHKELAQKITQLEHQSKSHDKDIRTIFAALHELIDPPEQPRKSIGFHP
ncbi:MAG: ORF6N domain-containing protein [Elusimicrobiota bacterium]|jgi:hypothetical protein